MSSVEICCLEILIPSLLATAYGFIVIFRKHRGLYFSMGVLAIFCMMIGQLVYILIVFSGHSFPSKFNIGTLGSVGSLLFFLTANLGPVEMLVDDRAINLKKYNRLALLGPVIGFVIFGLCIVLMVRRNIFADLRTGLILTVITMIPLYFSTRMVLLPDTDNGFADCMRSYNLTVVIYGFLITLERGMRNVWFDTPWEMFFCYLLYALLGLDTLAIMILLKRGAEKWKRI